MTSIRSLVYAKKWNDLTKAIKIKPNEAEVCDKQGDLPIHEACLQGAPFPIVQKLIVAYPEGVRKKGFCGRLPIHYASYKKPSINVIKLLLEYYPESASITDDDGRLPLHLAVCRNAPKDSILALINSYPMGIQIANKFGNTPLMVVRNCHLESLLIQEEGKSRDGNNQQEKKARSFWKPSNKDDVQNNGKGVSAAERSTKLPRFRKGKVAIAPAIEKGGSKLLKTPQIRKHPSSKKIFSPLQSTKEFGVIQESLRPRWR